MKKILKCLVLFIICVFLINGNIKAVDTTNSVETIDSATTEVEVPDTLSSRSTILIVISMFDIALGIGIINYVKENKIKE